jgi:hypothetical protein
MATNDANQSRTGRQLALQVVHTLRKNIAYNDAAGLAGVVGVLPKGAIILRGSVYVGTAFSTGTINIGKMGGDADEYASAVSIASQAVVAFDDLAIANQVISADTTVTFARSATASSGAASIVIEYSVDNG